MTGPLDSEICLDVTLNFTSGTPGRTRGSLQSDAPLALLRLELVAEFDRLGKMALARPIFYDSAYCGGLSMLFVSGSRLSPAPSARFHLGSSYPHRATGPLSLLVES